MSNFNVNYDFMERRISTEQEVDKLLHMLHSKSHEQVNVQNPFSSLKPEPKTKPVFRLNMVYGCLEILRVTADNQVYKLSKFFTEQEIAQLPSLTSLKLITKAGNEKTLPPEAFKFSDDGRVLLANGQIYKWHYGYFYSHSAEKFIRGNTLIYKAELYKQTYLFAQNLENGRISYLGYKYLAVNKNCFKIWLNGEWNAYFINHTTCSKICSGKEIIPMSKDKFKCINLADKSELWEFKKRSPQRYVSAK